MRTPNEAETWARDLRAHLDPDALVTAAPEVCARYQRDRRHFTHRPAPPGARPHLVLKPAFPQDIAAAVAWAYARRLPIVPRGLSTTAHGEVIPASGGLLIDLSQFNQIGPLDPDASAIIVQAGVAWGDLDAHLAAQGFALYTYPASRFSTVGGWVATGGLGINAFGYGHLRRWVTALHLVTHTGEIRALTPRDKAFDACFGAEGQMGVVAEVTLRVRPTPGSPRTHLFYFDSTRAQLDFVQHLIAARAHMAHLALLDQGYMTYLNRLYAEAHPGRTSFYEERVAVLARVESKAEVRTLEDALARADFLVEEAPPYAAAALWRQRFYPLVIKRYGPDLLTAPAIVPLQAAADFIDEVAELAEYFGFVPAVETVITPSEREGYAALVKPRFPFNARRRTYPLHVLMTHLVTRSAIRRGGRPYAIGQVNAPFVPAGRRQVDWVQRRAADPARRFNPRRRHRIKATLFRAVLKPARAFAAQIGHVTRLLHKPAEPPLPPPRPNKTDLLTDAELAATISACTGCGSCIPVCPAFLLTRDEATTARAKLQTGALLLQGEAVDPARAEATFMCTYCGACRDVCETELPLPAAYAAIEEKLSQQPSHPYEQTARFIAQVESNAAYRDFIGLSPLPAAEVTPGEPDQPAPPAPSRREPIGPYDVIRSAHCINCGRCAHVCSYSVHSRRADDPRRMAQPVSHRCMACLRCVQTCPTRALTVAPSPTYAGLGSGIYSPDTVLRLAHQATGAVELPAHFHLENVWLDVNPVMHPALPADEVETTVTLGRRLERLQIAPNGALTSVLPPVVEMALPLMLALPPGAPSTLADVLVRAAHTLNVLALVDWTGRRTEWAELIPSTALRLPADRLGETESVGESGNDTAPGLLVVEGLTDVIAYLRTRYPRLALAAEIPLDRYAPDAALELVSLGVDLVLLRGADGLRAHASPPDLLMHLPAVHRALTDAARRDRVSLVARGAVACVEHVMQAMLLGADAVMIDWPLLIALECRLQGDCAAGDHICGAAEVDPDQALARMVNLVRAWQGQLRAMLAALGLRRAHHLRDAHDRIIFDECEAELAGLRRLSATDLALVQLLGR